jgi:UDP-glucuronate 4-epimerase
MKIIVTGGAGFIGSRLCERLVKDGHELTVIDNLNDYYSADQKRANLASIRRVGDVAFQECDVCDEESMSRIFSAAGPDTLVHLAARAGVRPSIEQPLLYERVNVGGTTVLLEACRRFGVSKLIFASSSSIYGIANKVPFSEDDTNNLPISPYAATKLAGEKMCFTYSHLYDIKVVCLRFFTVYGPRQRPDLAIAKFVQMIDEDREITIFGDGMSARDYTYVDDIVQGIVASLTYDSKYSVFNLGNSYPILLKTLIELLENVLNKKAQIKRLPAQPGDVPITYADISKAQRELGYLPATAFEEGICKYMSWYRNKLLS